MSWETLVTYFLKTISVESELLCTWGRNMNRKALETNYIYKYIPEWSVLRSTLCSTTDRARKLWLGCQLSVRMSSNSKTDQTFLSCALSQLLHWYRLLKLPKSLKQISHRVLRRKAQKSIPDSSAFLPIKRPLNQHPQRLRILASCRTWPFWSHVCGWRRARRLCLLRTWSREVWWKFSRDCRSRTQCIFWRRCSAVSCRLWTWSWRWIRVGLPFASVGSELKHSLMIIINWLMDQIINQRVTISQILLLPHLAQKCQRLQRGLPDAFDSRSHVKVSWPFSY